MEYMLTAYCVVALLSMLIWSITDLLKEIRHWVDRVQGEQWLTLHAEMDQIRAEVIAYKRRGAGDTKGGEVNDRNNQSIPA